MEAGHERNINNMNQEDDYKPPWKDKDATTVNNTVNDTVIDWEYTFLNSWNDDESDLSKHVMTSKEIIKDTHVHDTSVGTTNVDPVVTGVGIIGQGQSRAISGGSITKGIIHGGRSIISSNVITHVLTDYSEMIIKSVPFPFNPIKSQTLVIAPLTKPFMTCDRDVRTSSKIEYSRPEHVRIGTPFVNKNICSGDDNFSVGSDVGEADKLDTDVQQSLTDERNTASSRIEEGSLESIFPKSTGSQIQENG